MVKWFEKMGAERERTGLGIAKDRRLGECELLDLMNNRLIGGGGGDLGKRGLLR
jgi:hypothetical protein